MVMVSGQKFLKIRGGGSSEPIRGTFTPTENVSTITIKDIPFSANVIYIKGNFSQYETESGTIMNCGSINNEYNAGKCVSPEYQLLDYSILIYNFQQNQITVSKPNFGPRVFFAAGKTYDYLIGKI